MFYTVLGKTLICKTRAIISADEDPSCYVYYISTVAAHKNGNPRKEPFMFDIITKNIDMSNVCAIPINMQDLITFYNNTHPEFEVFYDEKEPVPNLKMKKKYKRSPTSQYLWIDVYEIVEHFVKEKVKLNPTANFIFDELPIALDGNSKLSLSITHHISYISYEKSQ